jgi:hypothetical protein
VIYGRFVNTTTSEGGRSRISTNAQSFEEVARGWLVLAEQMEWMDRQRSTDEENDRSLC